MYTYYILELLIIIVFLSIFTIATQPVDKIEYVRTFAFCTSITILLLWVNLWAAFVLDETDYQFEYWSNLMPSNIAELQFGVDGLSLSLILLTAIIMPLCFIASNTITKKIRELLICLLLIELFIILSFYTTNLFFFYVFFESVLIPMFVLIGIWGSRDRKIKAAYYFFFYTLFGSLFMLFGILYLSNVVGSTNYEVLNQQNFSIQTHLFLFVLFFIPFAIKIPMFPFHIWLPEAHVEAPTIGSVILASLLLKLGSFGFLRFTIPLFWFGVSYFAVIIDVLAIISIIYASLATIRQIDLKRIIAYSSIAHMNLMVLGLFSLNQQGIDGAIYLMIGHGIVSSGLFFCVGVLYDRYHTRLIKYYAGLATVMPWFSFFFLMFTLANMSFPGTSNFIGELVILTGIFARSPFLAICAGTGIVLSAIYSIWIFNRTCFGTLKMRYINKYVDITMTEYLILGVLTILMLILGISSQPVFNTVWHNL